MTDHIALFRGINVGGRNLIPMKELVLIMEEAGAVNIRTYIQSGNVVFAGLPSAGEKAAQLIESKHGFRPEVLVLSTEDLERAIRNCPYAEAEGKACHFSFCKSEPGIFDKSRLEQLKADSEDFVLKDRVFYLHAPDGIGRSKLAANVERCLGVATTARNLNTVRKLSEMVNKSP